MTMWFGCPVRRRFSIAVRPPSCGECLDSINDQSTRRGGSTMLTRLVTAFVVVLPLLAAGPVSPQEAPDFDPAMFDVGLEEVAGGFAQPLFVTDAGDGSDRLFVVEKGG